MKSKILFALSLLFGLMFINSGLNKYLNYLPIPEKMPEKMVKAFGAFMEIGWLLPLVGLAEIIGGIFLIIPRTRALGAIIIFPIMVGILLTHIFQDQTGLPIAITLVAILIWVMFENRAKYFSLIK